MSKADFMSWGLQLEEYQYPGVSFHARARDSAQGTEIHGRDNGARRRLEFLTGEGNMIRSEEHGPALCLQSRQSNRATEQQSNRATEQSAGHVTYRSAVLAADRNERRCHLTPLPGASLHWRAIRVSAISNYMN
jgi:hypothetical protein